LLTELEVKPYEHNLHILAARGQEYVMLKHECKKHQVKFANGTILAILNYITEFKRIEL